MEGLLDKNSSLGLREVSEAGEKVPESTARSTGFSSSPGAIGDRLSLPNVQLKFYRSLSAPYMMLSTQPPDHKQQEESGVRGGGTQASIPKPAYHESPARRKKLQKSSKGAGVARAKPPQPAADSEKDTLPQISRSAPLVKTGIMDRLPLEVRCEHCGQLVDKKSLTRHTNWCLRQKQLRSKPDSRKETRLSNFKRRPDVALPRDSGNIVARVITVGLVPGHYEEVLIRSKFEESERPKTRTLRHSSLQQSGYGLPSLDRAVEIQGNVSDSQSPRMEQCKSCKKVIASDRLGVHYRLCKNPQLTTGVVQIPSSHNLLRVGSKKPSEPSPVHSRPPHKPPMIPCYICGREYGSKSLPIHEPQCLKKFNIQNDQLPIDERLPLPRKKSSAVARVLLREEEIATPCLPEGVYRNTGSGDGLVQKFFEHCYSEFEKELIPCKKCGRTFAPERHIKHEPNCNAKPLKML